MTFTQEDLAPLKEALLTGATTVSVAGRTVSFRSLSEIQKIIAMIEAQIEGEVEVPTKVQMKFIPRKRIY